VGDFLLKYVKDERDFKERLMDNIISFLQELGPGFALVSKEYKLVTPTNKNFYVDFLMYHTKIHAYVVIEVKIGGLTPSDFGQLHFYINAIDDLEKIEGDNQTVGLLLCKTADSYVVETSLKGMNNPIGVSKYKILEDLPAYLIDKMKTVE
jgi:RecB family endonuclease NucS